MIKKTEKVKKMTKTEAYKFITKGNHKLSPDVCSFDLPVTEMVCGKKAVNTCMKDCYARKPQVQYPKCLPSRERKLAFSKSPSFTSWMLKAIETLKPKYFRWHTSGEVYSQEYLDKIVTICKATNHISPHTRFYMYTKRLEDFDFTEALKLDNLVIIDSLMYDGLNFGVIDKAPKGSFICPDYKGSAMRIKTPKGPICGLDCTYCMTKRAQDKGVYFVQH